MVRNAKERIRDYVKIGDDKNFERNWVEFFSRIATAINQEASLTDSQWATLVSFSHALEELDLASNHGRFQLRLLELNLVIFVNLCKGIEEDE